MKLDEAERRLLVRVPREFEVMPPEDERALWGLEQKALVQSRQIPVASNTHPLVKTEWRLTVRGAQIANGAM
jgi:hypothetical protein